MDVEFPLAQKWLFLSADANYPLREVQSYQKRNVFLLSHCRLGAKSSASFPCISYEVAEWEEKFKKARKKTTSQALRKVTISHSSHIIESENFWLTENSPRGNISLPIAFAPTYHRLTWNKVENLHMKALSVISILGCKSWLILLVK